jgi:hypothetical protein
MLPLHVGCTLCTSPLRRDGNEMKKLMGLAACPTWSGREMHVVFLWAAMSQIVAKTVLSSGFQIANAYYGIGLCKRAEVSTGTVNAVRMMQQDRRALLKQVLDCSYKVYR